MFTQTRMNRRMLRLFISIIEDSVLRWLGYESGHLLGSSVFGSNSVAFFAYTSKETFVHPKTKQLYCHSYVILTTEIDII